MSAFKKWSINKPSRGRETQRFQLSDEKGDLFIQIGLRTALCTELYAAIFVFGMKTKPD